MKHPIKTKIILLITLLAGLFIMTYISCNKDDSTGKTIIKCVNCSNGGQCINDTCRCPAGWEGITCETLAIGKFIGTWSVVEKGSSSPGTQNYTINTDTGSATALIIYYLYNHGGPDNLYTNTSGDTLYIPTQTVNNYTFVGIGYLHTGGPLGKDGAITMRYMVTNTKTGVVNDFGYSSPNDSASQWIKE
jgi:hypothetical protein